MADEIQCQDRKIFQRKHKHIYTHILIATAHHPEMSCLCHSVQEKQKNDTQNPSNFQNKINLCVLIIQVTQQSTHGKQPDKMKIQTLP